MSSYSSRSLLVKNIQNMVEMQLSTLCLIFWQSQSEHFNNQNLHVLRAVARADKKRRHHPSKRTWRHAPPDKFYNHSILIINLNHHSIEITGGSCPLCLNLATGLPVYAILWLFAARIFAMWSHQVSEKWYRELQRKFH